MNKERFIKITMIVLPFMAMMLAGTPSAVSVYDVVSKTIAYTSFFVLVDGVTMTFCFPLAALACGVALAFSAARLVLRKGWMDNVVAVSAFVSVTLAVLPLMDQAEVILLPNMLFPVLMGVEALLGYLQLKKKEPENQAPRLKR